ncbi:MAG: hypothetical protein WD768_06700 [Phycisphaeraceae bacterium]
MMIHTRSLLIVASILILSFASADDARAADDAPQWFKGNLHTHSLWSDGNDFPEMITDWYASRDYHFLAISDHNILSKGEKWMNIRDINKRGNVYALDKYLKRFGEKWVEVRGEDPMKEIRLKGLEEFRGKFEKPGKFLLIQGEEITDKFGSQPVHMNATNIQQLIKPQGGKSVQEVIRNNIKQVIEQSEKTGKPILAHLNHPNFGYGVTAEDIAHVVEEQFFEVFNGHPGVNQTGDAKRPGIDMLWDIANTIRIDKLNAAPLYGLGTDDSHHYHNIKGDALAAKRSEPGRAWVMVRAKKLDAESLIEAMKQGDFYASTGVTLKDISLKDGVLTLEIAPDADATFETHFIGTKKGSTDIGEVLAKVDGVKPSYKLKGDELYVRALVISSKSPPNPTIKDQKEQAWTQPVGWQKHLKKE